MGRGKRSAGLVELGELSAQPTTIKQPSNEVLLTLEKSLAELTVDHTAGTGRTKDATIAVRPQQNIITGSNHFWSLSPETLNIILSNVRDFPSMKSLIQSCKTFYFLLMPRLHRRITIPAAIDGDITQLVRTINPYLTVVQRKQLEAEGRIKGNQKKYQVGPQDKVVPRCAYFVKELIVHVDAYEKRNVYIVEEYIQALTRNLPNLETVQTRVITVSMAKSLASLKNLKALDLESKFECKAEYMMHLAQVQNLKHLRLREFGWTSTSRGQNLHYLLLNSASTLESLYLSITSLIPLYYSLTNDKQETSQSTRSKEPLLKALKSLYLVIYFRNSEDDDKLMRVVDFGKLTELTLLAGSDCGNIFLQKLAQWSKRPTNGGGLHLKQLRLNIRHVHEDAEKELISSISALGTLISSFNSLEILEVDDYEDYPQVPQYAKSSLINEVPQAILRHGNLKTLKLHHNSTGTSIRYLSAQTVGAIVNGLPHLQDFLFAPEEDEIDEVAKALACGTQLVSITCSIYKSCFSSGRADTKDPHSKILFSIIKAFLNSARYIDMFFGHKRDHDGNEIGDENFVWEDNYKLRAVAAYNTNWELGSHFYDDHEKPTKILGQVWSEDVKRHVCFRDFRCKAQKDNEEWLTMVDRLH